jgi:anti-anti-sigma factor
MQFTSEHHEGVTVVTAGGRLTASQAGPLQRLLLEAFAGTNNVELSLRDVQEADLSFLQLLCAAHRTAAARGIGFRLCGLESAPAVTRLIRSAGAERGVGCPEGCLWPSGGPAAAAGGAVTPR